jgi:hypothetical protein
MAHAVVRHGRYQRASAPVLAAQATAKGSTISAIIQGRCTCDRKATAKPQLATANAAPRPGRFWATAAPPLAMANKMTTGDRKTAATTASSLT